MLCPNDFEVPENEILEKEDELIAGYRKKADFLLLHEAIGEATEAQAGTIDMALKDADSMLLGQAITSVLFSYIRELIKPDMEIFIRARKERLCEEHEERIHRRASGE
jgi:hypothetical protein